MDGRIAVRLMSPVKIDGKWHDADDEVAVPPEVARDLAKAGAVAFTDGAILTELAPGMPEYDNAVKDMAKTLADAAVQSAVDHATNALVVDRDAAQLKADDLENQNAQLQTRVSMLTIDLDAAQAREQEQQQEVLRLRADLASLVQARVGGNEGAGTDASVQKSSRKKTVTADQD
ncbi:MAG: hypothetical protein DI498_10955 [Paracoccus denitrificans]|nr:MAG: hypothetical protein DI498_10955 [Paracoccus denitrificans]PZO83660.1 MAG: hypothetical protein DI633_10955 [Paracoccus denitrificans]